MTTLSLVLGMIGLQVAGAIAWATGRRGSILGLVVAILVSVPSALVIVNVAGG